MSQREKRRASRRGALWEGARDYCNRGITLLDQGRLAESETNLRHALTLRPEFEDAHNILGNILLRQRKLEESEACYRCALKLNPDFAVAHSNLGNVLRQQDRLEEAETSCRRSLQLDPNNTLAHFNLAGALRQQRRWEESEASCRRAIELEPAFEKAHHNLGFVLGEQRRLKEAEASYRRALQLDPDYALAHSNLAGVLRKRGKWEEAVASYTRAFELEPTHGTGQASAFTALADTRLQICDWSDFAETARGMTRRVRKAQSFVDPFTFLAFSDDPGDQLRCGQQYIKHKIGSRSDPVMHKTGRIRDRIRLGYLSADFHDHPIAALMAELFELHDRESFEVFAFSLGPDQQGPMRRRLKQAFDHFIDMRNMSDAEAAAQFRSRGIDIAIDLGGYTTDSRPGILAPRPAPVQVNYLGYPGTMSANHIDYILVDPFIVPLDQQPHYAEKLGSPTGLLSGERHKACDRRKPAVARELWTS